MAEARKRRTNGEIRVSEVHLIGPDPKPGDTDKTGPQDLGNVATVLAQQLARDMGYDLVEVNPNVRPPVCKLMDYSKVKYQEQQREKKARQAAKAQELKEIRIRPKTGPHDLETKASQAQKFLTKGNKLKITIMMRGRERGRVKQALETLNDFADKLSQYGTVIHKPSSAPDGKTYSLTMEPRRK